MTFGKEIVVNRLHILDDMIATFKDDKIIDAEIKFIVVGESGIDQSGVSRDMYSSFWEAFYRRRTCGNGAVVPCITVEYSREDWLAVGRILVKGYKDLKVFPVRFSEAFLVAVLLGEQALTNSIMLSSLNEYVTDDVKELISRAHQQPLDEDEEMELLEFLADSGWQSTIPNSGNPEEIDKCLLQISHAVLIQNPEYPIGCIREVATEYFVQSIRDVQSVKNLLSELCPTNRKVVKLLRVEINTHREQKVFDLLKTYIR